MMKFFPALLVCCSLGAPAGLRAADDSFRAPDSLVQKDGRTVRGLIVKNTVDSVVLQERTVENSYAKSEIVRIVDVPNDGIEFTEALRRGDLPAWRVIANDLRTHDNIRTLVEIPATLIDSGVFKNVPYKSFRVNRDIELNIYGDPENPAGVEIGIYGRRRGDAKLQTMLRNYLAGFLTTRGELRAMYSLPLSGGLARAEELTFETTPPSAPDANGAWWISAFNERALAKARLSGAEYARLTRPVSEVIDHRGRLKAAHWSDAEMKKSARVDPDDVVMLRGFYRDKKGDFRLISEGSAQPAAKP